MKTFNQVQAQLTQTNPLLQRTEDTEFLRTQAAAVVERLYALKEQVISIKERLFGVVPDNPVAEKPSSDALEHTVNEAHRVISDIHSSIDFITCRL